VSSQGASQVTISDNDPGGGQDRTYQYTLHHRRQLRPVDHQQGIGEIAWEDPGWAWRGPGPPRAERSPGSTVPPPSPNSHDEGRHDDAARDTGTGHARGAAAVLRLRWDALESTPGPDGCPRRREVALAEEYARGARVRGPHAST
jgi:hypothetical protein